MTEEERFNPEEEKVSKEELMDLASSITNLEKPEMTEAGKKRGWANRRSNQEEVW